MIVLISGKQRSGKDTLACELSNLNDTVMFKKFSSVHLVSFARPIKHIVGTIQNILGLVNESKSARMAQIIGTQIGREIYGEDIWINLAESSMATLQRCYPNSLFIITDCRFQNEFKCFPEALRVRLSCPEDIRKARSEGKWRDTTDHISETDLDEYERLGLFDLVIDTSKVDSKGAAELVRAQLLKNSWMEKRKK